MALNSYKEERKNMSYTALYRKFRPDAFSDVKGQDHIVTTLKNQLRANRIGHAYLFTGTRGTGKTTVAKIFAKTVNCEHPTEDGPCGECRICKAIAAGASMNVIEIDAASNNSVSNIRDIVEEVAYSPTEGKYKVYIIDEVHMLSASAFAALLKTLEEPPAYVIFILATTEVHMIPITILSRCQRYDFKRLTVEQIEERMKEALAAAGEELPIEEKALKYLAKSADGAMRDAWSLLDQCLAFHFGHELTYDMVLDVLGAVDTSVFSKLLRCVIARDVAGCIGVLVIGGAVVVSRHSTYEQKENETENGTETASVSRVVKQPADLMFWYSDKSYQKFFEKAAEEYYEDTGIVVDAEYQDSMDYMDAVYTATMQGETFPDIYMIGSDELEEAYLYGLAAENTASDIYESTVASNAVTASTYKEKMYAYPLSYNTCLFVYKNGYFETEPETLQAIIDYSIDNEPPENVQYLLEWDVNDAFYDFPFISNSVSFVKDEVETMQVNYDEDLYNEDLEFFSQSLESFSIDASTVTEASVISDFNDGKTLCAIIDSDSVAGLTGTLSLIHI